MQNYQTPKAKVVYVQAEDVLTESPFADDGSSRTFSGGEEIPAYK